MSHPPALVWFRQDLRLADHPALDAAVRRGGPVIPVYLWAPEEEGDWPPGAASRWWIHHALASLDAELRRDGNALVIRRGPAEAALVALARETGAGAVFWNHRHEPAVRPRDKRVLSALRAAGLEARGFNGSALFEPGDILTKQGAPYQVFTPFHRACLAAAEPRLPLPAPPRVPPPERPVAGETVAALGLLPTIPWAGELEKTWRPGRQGAAAALDRFLDEAMAGYKQGRDCPSRAGTSRLSPYLHHGELSPNEVWHAVRSRLEAEHGSGWMENGEACLRQLVWREFAAHLLHHFPHTPREPLREAYADFPWENHAAWLKAWQRGRTGYPLVDAGMRELWRTGWMHNRARMITASFLVKHLLIPWQRGAEWFWDTLVDADLANNTLGWQWTAGCGADAAPYFRIFNPITQGEKFGAHDYVRRFVPEIAELPDPHLFSPWTAPRETLVRAGVRLGETYPRPLVDHAEARDRALAALSTITGGR